MTFYKHQNGYGTPRDCVTRDHVEQKSHGGINFENLVAACVQCNGLRGDMEAIAFYNLMQKWFRADPTLRGRWYTLTNNELRPYRNHCLKTHAEQLQGLGVRHREYAFRHLRLLYTHGYQLVRI